MKASMRRQWRGVLALGILMSGFLFPLTARGAASPPAEGGLLPDFTLEIPQGGEEKQYLGLQAKDRFKVPEIRADLVILEVFSMYCPYCQKEAPVVNELYSLIAARPGLQEKVKIIGIGAGNTAYEVGLFKKTYKIPFPLFPDADLSIHTKLGEVRTPYFIGIRIKPDGSHQVVYSKLGAFGDPEKFLDLVLKSSGLN